MRLIAAGLLAVLTVAAGATHAQARPYGGSEGPSWTRESVAGGMRRSRASSTGRLTRAAVGGRPAKWCGWWLRTQKQRRRDGARAAALGRGRRVPHLRRATEMAGPSHAGGPSFYQPAPCVTITIHDTPKRSATMPNRGEKNVLASGIWTCPPSPSAPNS